MWEEKGLEGEWLFWAIKWESPLPTGGLVPGASAETLTCDAR